MTVAAGRVCKRCGGEFKKAPHQMGKVWYCPPCRHERKVRTCPTCGVTFWHKMLSPRFCSNRCRANSPEFKAVVATMHAARAEANPRPEVRCEQCGDVVPPERVHAGRTRFCSRTCYAIAVTDVPRPGVPVRQPAKPQVVTPAEEAFEEQYLDDLEHGTNFAFALLPRDEGPIVEEGDPTPEEIAERAEEIRSEWEEVVRLERLRSDWRDEGWVVPVAINRWRTAADDY